MDETCSATLDCRRVYDCVSISDNEKAYQYGIDSMINMLEFVQVLVYVRPNADPRSIGGLFPIDSLIHCVANLFEASYVQYT